MNNLKSNAARSNVKAAISKAKTKPRTKVPTRAPSILSTTSIRTLHDEHDLLHLLVYRHKNAHRQSLWFKHLRILKRSLSTNLHSSDPSHFRRLLNIVIPSAYEAFTHLVKSTQYAGLGMVLLGILARVWSVLSETMGEDEERKDEEEANVLDDLSIADDNGNKLQASLMDLAGDDVGEPVQRSEMAHKLIPTDVSTIQTDTNVIAYSLPICGMIDMNKSALASVNLSEPSPRVECEEKNILGYAAKKSSNSVSSLFTGDEYQSRVDVSTREISQKKEITISKHTSKRRKKKTNAIDDLFGNL